MLNSLSTLFTVGVGYLVAISCVVNVNYCASVSVYGNILVSFVIRKALKRLFVIYAVNYAICFCDNIFCICYSICTIKTFNHMVNLNVNAVCCPFSRISNVFSRHCSVKLRRPAHKFITYYLEIRSFNCAFIRKYKSNILSRVHNITIGKSYCVFVSCVVNVYFSGAILSYNFLISILIRSAQKVDCIIASVNHKLRSIRNSLTVLFNISVSVKRCHHVNNCYRNRLTYLPFCCKGNISCRHCFGNCRIPANMDITGSAEYRS